MGHWYNIELVSKEHNWEVGSKAIYVGLMPIITLK